MVDPAPELPNWEEIGVQLLHPTQIVIIEAMAWIDLPISPRILQRFSPDTGIGLGHFSYHCRRLTKLKIVEKVGSVPRRGAAENYYFFATDSDKDSSFYYFLPDAGKDGA